MTPHIKFIVSDTSWYAYDKPNSDKLRAFVLTEADKQPGDLFNDKKIRIASDIPVSAGKSVTLQKTDYLSSLMTDQIAWRRIYSYAPSETQPHAPKEILWDGVSAFISGSASEPDARLMGLADAQISNQLGCSTLAISDDGHLLIVLQSKFNFQSVGLLAPSGSGSMDWSGIKSSGCEDDLLSLVSFGAQRELREECALNSDIDDRRYIPSAVLPIAFTRMLHRGGKPEFYFIGRVGGTFEEIRARKPERYVELVLRADVQPVDLKSECLIDGVKIMAHNYLKRAV